MNYYRYLDLNWQPASEKLKRYFLTKNPEFIANNSQGSWRLAPPDIHTEVPELKEMFDPIGLTILFVGFFVTFKNESSIHIDNDERPLRINFPVLNCENTETRFYKLKAAGYDTKSQTNGLTYKLLDPESCVFVDKFELSKAVVMRVLEPHQVVVNSKEFPRVSCTVQFNEDITHLLE